MNDGVVVQNYHWLMVYEHAATGPAFRLKLFSFSHGLNFAADAACAFSLVAWAPEGAMRWLYRKRCASRLGSFCVGG